MSAHFASAILDQMTSVFCSVWLSRVTRRYQEKTTQACEAEYVKWYVRQYMRLYPPSPMAYISNSASVANEVRRPRVFQVLLEDGVEAASLVAIAVARVGDVRGAVAGEVAALALHGADAGVLWWWWWVSE